MKKFKMIGERQSLFLDRNVEIGPNVLFDTRGGNIEIKGPSYLIGNTKIHASGGKISIGRNVTIGDYSFLNGAGDLLIEDDVLCADKVNMISTNHVYTDVNFPIRDQGSVNAPIIIRKGCWIGINVSILAGTEIGKNSVVGANSVVKGKFPDYCVIAGNPACIVKRFDGKEWVK